MSDGKPGPMPQERPDASRQPDLFDARGRADVRQLLERPARSTVPVLASLTDDELIELLPDAGPSDIDALCHEIAARSLAVAVPALEALWSRFHGFGIERPLREQCAVLETLTRLDGPEPRAVLRRIVLRADLPTGLLSVVLRAAADAGLSLPTAFVAGFLDRDDPAVRAAAFDLAFRANVPAPQLRGGLSDRMAPIRRAAAVALAHRGDASGRDVLTDALATAPSTVVVEALGAIGDDEAIVALGRCAVRHAALAPHVIAILRDTGNARAGRLAARLEAERARPIAGKTP